LAISQEGGIGRDGFNSESTPVSDGNEGDCSCGSFDCLALACCLSILDRHLGLLQTNGLLIFMSAGCLKTGLRAQSQ
jgi:hypothetical protein